MGKIQLDFERGVDVSRAGSVPGMLKEDKKNLRKILAGLPYWAARDADRR